MADLLELECPGCTGRLELDAGFAGGVCRCSLCGTLMTVPADPSSHQAERLSRPDSPGGRPEAPGQAPAPAGVENDTAAPAEAAGEPGAETFVTDTGRVVRVGRDAVIPTAPRKRAVIRATTAVVFFGVVGLLLALMGGAIWVMLQEPPPEDTAHLALQHFVYDREANPWTLEAPNVLGMSLGPKAAVVVDASARSSGWLPGVNSAIAAGLTRADSGAQVALIYATADGVETLGGGMRGIGWFSESRITRFQDGIEAGGEPPLRRAIEAAVEMEPIAVVLVIGRRVGEQDLSAARSVLTGSGVLLDVIAVGRDDPALDQLARDTGGRYQFVSTRTLDGWREDVREDVPR